MDTKEKLVPVPKQDTTLQYYNQNAKAFSDGTTTVLFFDVQEIFLKHLQNGATILDFGCGAGRDTKYFIDKGYRVDAIDGSRELCKIASDYTGITVQQMRFQELDIENKYDGIWACASILHLKKPTLAEVLQKMLQALKQDGIIYTSFKYGTFCGMRRERYFTDFTEEGFSEFVQGNDRIEIIEMWVTDDVRPGRGNEKWLNVILRKIA